jgi:hypothetical protein
MCSLSNHQKVQENIAYDQDARTTNGPLNIDHDSHPKDWLHPADTVKITEHHDDNPIQIFTDGSMSVQGVGAV